MMVYNSYNDTQDANEKLTTDSLTRLQDILVSK